MPSSNLTTYLVAAIVLPGLAIYFIWYFRRSRALLADWAAKNRLEITRSKRRWFLQGPYTFLTFPGQTVYRVTVRDHHGRVRSGWVRCGDSMLGVFIDTIDTHWDHE